MVHLIKGEMAETPDGVVLAGIERRVRRMSERSTSVSLTDIFTQTQATVEELNTGRMVLARYECRQGGRLRTVYIAYSTQGLLAWITAQGARDPIFHSIIWPYDLAHQLSQIGQPPPPATRPWLEWLLLWPVVVWTFLINWTLGALGALLILIVLVVGWCFLCLRRALVHLPDYLTPREWLARRAAFGQPVPRLPLPAALQVSPADMLVLRLRQYAIEHFCGVHPDGIATRVQNVDPQETLALSRFWNKTNGAAYAAVVERAPEGEPPYEALEAAVSAALVALCTTGNLSDERFPDAGFWV